MSIIISMLLLIDGLIYDLVGWMFKIFDFLVTTNLFSNDSYSGIVRRVYIILGLIMMFALAYSLLKAVINPDEFSKGENSFPKLIKNVVVSLIIIAILPTVFTLAFNIQNSIINENTIPKLVLGDEYVESKYLDPGRTIAFNAYTAFLHIDPETCSELENTQNSNIDSDTCDVALSSSLKNAARLSVVEKRISDDSGDLSFNVIKENVASGKLSFSYFNLFSDNVEDGEISYYMIISTICGLFLLWVIASFCFDMALRVVKLMFFEIIAPIPVVCRVIPGGKMKDVFPTWVKKTVSTFLDALIRIFVMYLGIFVLITILDGGLFDSYENTALSYGQLSIAKALVIVGVITFIKQAPKLLADMFHLDIGDMKLGIREKLAAGGVLAAGGLAMGSLGSVGRNLVATGKNLKKADSVGGVLKALGAGAVSVGAGGLSGAVRGLKGAKGAKNFADVRKAAGAAVDATSAAKAKRDAKVEAYKAKHPDANFAEVLAGTAIGSFVDKASAAGEYFGLGDDLSSLQKEQAAYQQGMGFKKKLFDLVADNERVLAYTGLKTSAQERDINSYVSDLENKISAQGFSNKDDVGYYKINAVTNQKEYYKDANNKIVNDLTSLAIEQKVADIKKYDDAIKLASLDAIHDKIESGDGRFSAVLEEFKVWQSENASNPDIIKLDELVNLDAAQSKAIKDILASNNAVEFSNLVKAFEGDTSDNIQQFAENLGISSLGIMKNDKEMKIANGRTQEEIAKRVQEKKKENS